LLQNPGRVLRDLMKGKEVLVAPGAYDGFSARLIEEAGFKVAYRTGAGAAATMLGQPDIGLMTMSETVSHAANIAAAIKIPVIADADTGYGNALNVIRTVHEFERAGVAAIHLEDQVFPKRCGHLEGKKVIPMEEFVAKIKAAVNERMNKDFVIIARTDARAVEGVEKAIERCKHYVEAGADMIFFEAPQSLDEIETVAEKLAAQVPLLINMVGSASKTPAVNVKELEQMGYKVVIFPSACTSPALVKMREALVYLKEKGTDEGLVASPLALFRVVGIEDWMELEKKYVA